MALWIAMTAGCASAPGRLQAPKAVFGLELGAYAITEECIALEPGGWRGVSDCRDAGEPWSGTL